MNLTEGAGQGSEGGGKDRAREGVKESGGRERGRKDLRCTSSAACWRVSSPTSSLAFSPMLKVRTMLPSVPWDRCSLICLQVRHT